MTLPVWHGLAGEGFRVQIRICLDPHKFELLDPDPDPGVKTALLKHLIKKMSFLTFLHVERKILH
jgi:hypothetical protein